MKITPEEISALGWEILSDIDDYIQSLKKTISESEKFSNFKPNLREDDFYNGLIKLVVSNAFINRFEKRLEKLNISITLPSEYVISNYERLVKEEFCLPQLELKGQEQVEASIILNTEKCNDIDTLHTYVFNIFKDKVDNSIKNKL